MTARTPLAVQPHLYIGDSTGRPLDNGKVYFGQPDKDPELYPINVFYDEARTIAALQPVTTKGGFMSVNGNMTEIYAAEAIYSVKALDQYDRQVLYKAEMYRNKIGDLLSDEIERSTTVDQALTSGLSGEITRATNAEGVISGNLTTEVTRATNAEQAIDTKFTAANTALDNKIISVAGGKRSYTTYALMTADAANIPANSSIDVIADTDTTKNGTYAYNGTSFTKSAYDPLTQAKSYTDTAKTSAISTAATDATTKSNNAKTQAVADSKTYTDTLETKVNQKVAIDVNSDDLHDVQDSAGVSLYKIDKNGKHIFYGLESDLVTTIDGIKAKLPTAEQQAAITLNPSKNTIFEINDNGGKVTLKQTDDAHLHVPILGDITKNIINLNNGSGNERLNLPAAHLMGKYADAQLVQNMTNYNVTATLLTYGQVDALGIFPHIVNRLRIPAITRIGKSKYLLCFEGRTSIDDFAEISMGTAIINVDPTTKAATLSNIQSVHNSFVDTDGKKRNFLEGVTVKLDSGKIILMYIRRHERTEHEVYMRTSDDNGVTWSDFTDISYVKNAQNLNVLATCSQGLVKRYGQHKGRIIFPAWTTGTAYEPKDYRSGYIYSDDDGVTWNLGEFCDYAGSNEVQIAEYLNGDMMFSVRLLIDANPRVMLKHSDITKEFSEIKTDHLALGSESIMSGLIQAENKYDLSANKFQLSTAKLAGRQELNIHTSYDGGETWYTHLLQSTAGQWVAYSCIERLDEEHNFLLWESNSESNFDYAVVSLNNLVEVK